MITCVIPSPKKPALDPNIKTIASVKKRLKKDPI